MDYKSNITKGLFALSSIALLAGTAIAAPPNYEQAKNSLLNKNGYPQEGVQQGNLVMCAKYQNIITERELFKSFEQALSAPQHKHLDKKGEILEFRDYQSKVLCYHGPFTKEEWRERFLSRANPIQKRDYLCYDTKQDDLDKCKQTPAGRAYLVCKTEYDRKLKLLEKPYFDAKAKCPGKEWALADLMEKDAPNIEDISVNSEGDGCRFQAATDYARKARALKVQKINCEKPFKSKHNACKEIAEADYQMCRSVPVRRK
tara:strand:+ start:20945 stop:21721 length:777 start_codon:yes stop_codon:yes gene_type:complete